MQKKSPTARYTYTKSNVGRIFIHHRRQSRGTHCWWLYWRCSGYQICTIIAFCITKASHPPWTICIFALWTPVACCFAFVFGVHQLLFFFAIVQCEYDTSVNQQVFRMRIDIWTTTISYCKIQTIQKHVHWSFSFLLYQPHLSKDQTTFSTHHILHLPLASPQLVPQKLCRFGECLSILFATSEVSLSVPPVASSIASNISLILQLNPP